jgi:hypothetical protein
MTERLPILCVDCKTEFATHEALHEHSREMAEALAPDSDDTSGHAELKREHEEVETKRQSAAIKRAAVKRAWNA